MFIYLCDEPAKYYPSYLLWRANDIAHMRCSWHTDMDVIMLDVGNAINRRDYSVWRLKAHFLKRYLCCWECIKQLIDREKIYKNTDPKYKLKPHLYIMQQLMSLVDPKSTVTNIPRPDRKY